VVVVGGAECLEATVVLLLHALKSVKKALDRMIATHALPDPNFGANTLSAWVGRVTTASTSSVGTVMVLFEPGLYVLFPNHDLAPNTIIRDLALQEGIHFGAPKW
jgi:hypothetical protein